MRDSFARTLYDIGHKTKDVFIVVADISPAGSMAPFRNDFPDRFINVGVAEQSMIGLCAGLALRGCRPFAYTIATFAIYRPFEQVRVDVCYQNLAVTIVGIGGGISYSTLGGTHHAQEDVAIMSALPNMTVLAPCDAAETAAATWAAVERNGPVYLRLGKAGEPDLTSKAVDPYVFGKIRRLRQGRDICFLSYGPITKMAFDAAEVIEKESGATVAVTGTGITLNIAVGNAAVDNTWSANITIVLDAPCGYAFAAAASVTIVPLASRAVTLKAPPSL